jgi:hypothetical protein
MEGLTRLVSESLARHGFDRPLDYRRLQWSRWFRCDSHHSLLFVPSKPGVFALAEEVMDFGRKNDYMETLAKPALSVVEGAVTRSEASGVPWTRPEAESRKPEADSPRRMLAVTQFFEDEDMAFVLDRMVSRPNSMNARLTSGRYFARYVVIDDQTQRRSICNALNQWIVSATEKATGIGSHFATSLELTPATEYVPQADDRQQSLFAGTADPHVATAASAACPEPGRRVPRSEASGSRTEPGFSVPVSSPTVPQLNSGAATHIHCPSPFPSGF